MELLVLASGLALLSLGLISGLYSEMFNAIFK